MDKILRNKILQNKLLNYIESNFLIIVYKYTVFVEYLL